jgi:hypothetical protein
MTEMMSNSCLNWQVLLMLVSCEWGALTEMLNDGFRCLLQLPINFAKESDCVSLYVKSLELTTNRKMMRLHCHYFKTIIREPKHFEALAQIIA